MGVSGSMKRNMIVGSAAIAGFHVLRDGYAANQDLLKVGVIGCGGRGTGAVRDILVAGSNVSVVAMADVSKSQIEQSLAGLRSEKNKYGDKLRGLDVTPDRCFTGLDGYKQVIDSDVDIVILTTPPGFRPLHFEYAVQKNKHIFCEKPCATDPVGVRRIRNLETVVRSKGLSVVCGFQRRHCWEFQELIRRIHDGNIGPVLTGRAYYNADGTPMKTRPAGVTDLEWMYMNWYRVDWLSGDHIVEQAVHNIDLVNWVMNRPPLTAYGSGGIQFHHDLVGNIYDHFCVEYDYGDARVTFMCRQIPYTDGTRGGIFFGTQGTANCINSAMEIQGPLADSWQGEWATLGRVQEHVNLLRSIRESRPMNQIMILCDSTLMAIMGREAAYTGKVVTWNEMMESDLNLVPKDIAQWDGGIRPVPKPGTPRG